MILLVLPVNYLPIIAATVLAFLLGAIWYSPLFFGNPWFESYGILPKSSPAETARRKNPATHAVAVAIMLILAYVLDVMLLTLQVTSVADALSVGCILWLGFIATIGFINVIYENRSLSVFVVHIIYCLTYLELMAVVLTLAR